MFLSMNWICDYVDLSGLDKLSLIHRFSLSTAEVENEIFMKGSDLSGIVVAEIKSVEEHPESKKLHLLKVDIGEAELVDVVCGAPNVAVGLKVPFAKLGAQIGEITIAPRKLAGFTSNGMCCSEKELGISDNNDGLMILDPAFAVGTDIKTLFDIDDIIFEVDNKSLTNRPDLWGHYGIAREFAAIAGRELKPLDCADLTKYNDLPPVDMKIEDSLCQRYSCLQVENITRRVSPVNMRIRLFYCGMRSINFLTDITNYIMLEMGQPMHAFDSRKVEKLRIKRYDHKFTFKTLDGVERNIDEDMLMICNGDIPVCIAGVMGGLDSEIVEDTTKLTLECATFDAVSVRKTTVRLAHRTDASQRYEKCLDPEMTPTAVARFVKIMQDADPGAKVISSLTDEQAYKYPTITFSFDRSFVNRYTGIEISDEHILTTLSALGFGISLEGTTFTVTVPSWRCTKDVTMKADIIEEITRIYGYDNFDINTVYAPSYPIRADIKKSVEEQIKDLLVKRFSCHELHSYIWTYNDEYKELGIEVEDNVKIAGAANPNIETLRKTIIPTQLCQVKYNTAYAPEFGVFEIGCVVDGLREDGLCNEKKKLAITLYSKTEGVETVYGKLCNILAVLADDIKHAPVKFVKKEATHSYQHPRNLNAVFCGETEIGEIGVVYPTVSKKIDKKAAIVYAEIDVTDFANCDKAALLYDEPSKYPEMDIDLTFKTDIYTPIGEAISAHGGALVKNVKVTDRYADESGKSVTVRITFADKTRTLTRDEVMVIANKVIADLAVKGIALKA
ncbi:MAG: phenylalanine--tRNA ligase subunit beta [Clostridia bacterium]|nr:phenylalanine--tRNA ligase subunit beta [Clostridia bacterium]